MAEGATPDSLPTAPESDAVRLAREEYVAALDPYLRPLPARFDKGRRYRLDLLGPDAASAGSA